MEPGVHASQVPSVPHPLLSAHAMGSRAGEGRSLCAWLPGTSPPLMVVGSGDGADSVCPLLGSGTSSDGGCQGWMERAGVGWVGATFPGGFIFFPGGLVWQWWDFHECWDDHREEACEGGAAEPCIWVGFPCPPQGDQGSQSLGCGGKHLCLAGAGLNLPPWLNEGLPPSLAKMWLGHPSHSVSHAPALA